MPRDMLPVVTLVARGCRIAEIAEIRVELVRTLVAMQKVGFAAEHVRTSSCAAEESETRAIRCCGVVAQIKRKAELDKILK